MESTDSSTGSQPPQLPPGFRFHPTDEELVVHYLKKKLASIPLPVSIIAEIDLYKFDPWELPARASFGEQEWYFFSPRDRKYPNGSRPNRSATSGYWKATGTDKPVVSSTGNQKVGVKKSLVFYTGKPPKGIKTNWIMHEYRVVDNKSISKPPATYDAAQRGSLRLDEWVLCRIYKKTDTVSTTRQEVPIFFSGDESLPQDHRQQSLPPLSVTDHEDLQGMQTSNYLAFLENQQNMFDHRMMSCSNSGYLLSHESMMGASSGVMPVKQQALPAMYWNDEHSSTTSSSARIRYVMDNCDESVVAGVRPDETNTIASLLDQQAMLGSLGDGNRINWYS